MKTLDTIRRMAPAAALLVSACTAASPQPASLVQRGQALFVEQGCYGCHTVKGTGTPIANDLTHVGAKYGEAELARRVRDPALHRPGAHMPKLDLTAAEVEALAAYLATLH
jgi:cytochrome c oxidase subunit 2